MSPEPADFATLRRLLALKRHESPPPGYFDQLAHRIVARIEAGDLREKMVAVDAGFWEVSWFQRLWVSLQVKPAFAGAFGLTLCALFITGVLCLAPPSTGGDILQAHGSLTAAIPSAQASPVFVSSTNGLMPFQPTTSLFDNAQPRVNAILTSFPASQ